MSQQAQQFDFSVSKEELIDILMHIEKGGLRIEYQKTEKVSEEVTRVYLHHNMNAFTYGDKILADISSNPDGSSHMNIVSSNFGLISYGVHSKNISAIATFIEKEIHSLHPAVSKSDAMDELLKLKKLLDAGIINEEEYQQKKEKLLRKIG